MSIFNPANVELDYFPQNDKGLIDDLHDGDKLG
jgi:hypothetical protein